MDTIGWFIGTLHQLIGHDAAAAVIGGAQGDKAACLMCQYEREPNDLRRQAVYRALRPTSIGEPETANGQREGALTGER